MVRRTDFWIEVEIKTDILFPSASAQLEPNAVGVIEKLGEALAPFPNPIRVEGHTDNRPIKTVAFISNWELSAARAGSVVRVLASKGVEPGRLAVIGYGENRPTHPNDTVEGRNSNRRVVVVILSTDTSSSPTTPGQNPETPNPDGTPAGAVGRRRERAGRGCAGATGRDAGAQSSRRRRRRRQRPPLLRRPATAPLAQLLWALSQRLSLELLATSQQRPPTRSSARLDSGSRAFSGALSSTSINFRTCLPLRTAGWHMVAPARFSVHASQQSYAF